MPFLALLVLSACDVADTAFPDDTAPEAAALAVGDLADLTTAADGSVSIDLAEAGTYIVVLASTEASQGTLWGYGASAGMRLDPADPAPAGREAGTPPPAVTEGDIREFTVWNGSRMTTVEALAVRVTDAVVLWEDQTTPNEIGEVVEETIDAVLANLETIVLPRERAVFGQESDVDGDGRIAVLLSYTVNQYGAQAYVTWCDIGLSDGCGSYGNDSEIVYLSYPDPDDTRASPAAISETVAHEFNHLVYAYHKHVLNGRTGTAENVYVTEGAAALAQDLTGYNNGNQYVWAAALDMSETYGSDDYSIQAVSVNDLIRGESYYDEERDGALRGGGYLLLRYLFEQAGGMSVASDGTLTDTGGMTWAHAFFDAPQTGVDAVEATTGRDLWDVVQDWYTALVVTGRGINDDPAFNYEPRVEDPLTGYSYGVDPFATIHGWLELTGPKVQAWDEADGEIRAGGVEYLQVTAPAGLLVLPVAPEALARARILRIE